MALTVCAEPSCPELSDRRYCDQHRREDRKRRDQRRPTAAQRGYDSKWRRNSARFLQAHPHCTDCGEQATVADHDPIDRAELVRRGDPHPDAWHHLKPRCKPCHDKRTGRTAAR